MSNNNHINIECKAHLQQYSVKALKSLDKSIKLTIYITETSKRSDEILQQLALMKADELIKLIMIK